MPDAESLVHKVVGCSTYLNEGRYTWRHNSVLQVIASTPQTIKGASLFVALPGFVSPSVITGDILRPDLLLEFHNKYLYILELTIGYESNLTSNIVRKDRKYQDLTRTLQHHYNNVKFINRSINTLGVFSSHSVDFTAVLKELSMDDRHLAYIQRKISSITIRSTYYVFCRKGQDWSKPDLFSFLIQLSFSFSFLCFVNHK